MHGGCAANAFFEVEHFHFILIVRLDCTCVWAFWHFLFFFMHVCQRHYALFNGSCALFTGPTNTLFRKNGLTVLFTHLKIILLQYFQFLIFNKINSIQMNSNTLYFSLLALLVCPPTKTRDSLVRKKYPRYNNGLKI